MTMSNSDSSTDGTVDAGATGLGGESDHLREREIELETVTNDAVAGETVLPGPGDGNDGPTGGAEREATPIYDEHDPQTEAEVDLDDEPDEES
jgi:hypothetical protein